jgi:hypothetical protein
LLGYSVFSLWWWKNIHDTWWPWIARNGICLILLGYLFSLSYTDGDGKAYDMVAMIRYIWYMSYIVGLFVFLSSINDDRKTYMVAIIRL